jgi:hypothetical protein
MPTPSGTSITTPRCRLAFPKLVQPDFGTKDYPKPDGEFVTKAVMRADDPKVQAFLKKLQPHHDAAVRAGKAEFAKLKPETRRKLKDVTVNQLFTELLDKTTEEPTGEIEFKFARKASGERKDGTRWKAKVPIFDRFGQRIENPPEIWGGTVAAISFRLATSKDFPVPGYFIPGTGAVGLKLELEAVQIIELRSGGEKDAAGYGFEAEEFDADAEGENDDPDAEQTPDF